MISLKFQEKFVLRLKKTPILSIYQRLQLFSNLREGKLPNLKMFSTWKLTIYLLISGDLTLMITKFKINFIEQMHYLLAVSNNDIHLKVLILIVIKLQNILKFSYIMLPIGFNPKIEIHGSKFIY